MGGQLAALVPSQRLDQVRRQRGDALLERLDDVLGRAVIAQTGEQHVPGLALDQRRDRRPAGGADQQIALPVARDTAIVGLGRAIGDRDHVDDPPAHLDPAARLACAAAGAQIGRKLAAQLAARLHIQRAVDRLVADAHQRIIGMIELQPRRDLLRRPAPQQTFLDGGQQPRARRQLGRLGTLGGPLGAALTAQRAIPLATAATRDLTADRGAMASQRPGDLAIALAATDALEDPLALLKRQPTPRPLTSTTHQRRLITDPPRRRRRGPELGHHLLNRSAPQQPRPDRHALHRRQPPIRPTPHPRHDTSDRSTPPMVLRRPDESAHRMGGQGTTRCIFPPRAGTTRPRSRGRDRCAPSLPRLRAAGSRYVTGQAWAINGGMDM